MGAGVSLKECNEGKGLEGTGAIGGGDLRVWFMGMSRLGPRRLPPVTVPAYIGSQTFRFVNPISHVHVQIVQWFYWFKRRPMNEAAFLDGSSVMISFFNCEKRPDTRSPVAPGSPKSKSVSNQPTAGRTDKPSYRVASSRFEIAETAGKYSMRFVEYMTFYSQLYHKWKLFAFLSKPISANHSIYMKKATFFIFSPKRLTSRRTQRWPLRWPLPLDIRQILMMLSAKGRQGKKNYY